MIFMLVVSLSMVASTVRRESGGEDVGREHFVRDRHIINSINICETDKAFYIFHSYEVLVCQV